MCVGTQEGRWQTKARPLTNQSCGLSNPRQERSTRAVDSYRSLDSFSRNTRQELSLPRYLTVFPGSWALRYSTVFSGLPYSGRSLTQTPALDFTQNMAELKRVTVSVDVVVAYCDADMIDETLTLQVESIKELKEQVRAHYCEGSEDNNNDVTVEICQPPAVDDTRAIPSSLKAICLMSGDDVEKKKQENRMLLETEMQNNVSLKEKLRERTDALERALNIITRKEAEFRGKDALILLAELVKIIGRTLAQRVKPEMKNKIKPLYVVFGTTNQVVFYDDSDKKTAEAKDEHGVLERFTRELKTKCSMQPESWTRYARKMNDVRNRYCHRVPFKYTKREKFRKLMMEAANSASIHKGLFKQGMALLEIAKTFTGRRTIRDVFGEDMWEEGVA
jgi:hypothetical protein